MDERDSAVPIDTTTPSDSVLLAEARDAVVMQHGGVVTRITFSECEVMDVPTFVKEEVPKLGELRDTLVLMKDVGSERVALMLGNNVTLYKVTDMEQCGIEEFADMLQTAKPETLIPDIQYPLVCMCTTAHEKLITVAVPPTRISFHLNDGTRTPLIKDITLPPIWFKVRLNMSNGFLGCSIAVVPERTAKCMDTSLYVWPLPNVHTSAEVCLGSTSAINPISKNATLGEIIGYQLNRVLTSMYNYDLTWNISYDNVIGSYYASLPEDPDIAAKLNRESDTSHIGCLKTIRCLMEPNGHMMLQYPSLRISAKQFLTGGNR